MKELSFCQPKPGEEIWVPLGNPNPFAIKYPDTVSTGTTAFNRELSRLASSIQCNGNGRFEQAHVCPFCPGFTAVFVAALLTFFLEGPDAASKYYKD